MIHLLRKAIRYNDQCCKMSIKKSFKEIVTYYLLSFTITLLALISFYNGTGNAENTLTVFYAVTIPTYYFFIFLPVTLLFFPFSVIPYFRYIIILPKVLIDFLLIADVFVFRIYRFHIDLMFIDMMINDYHGIGISYYIVIIALIVFLTLILLNVYLFKVASKIRTRPVGYFYLVMLILFLSGQSIHIWGSKFNRQYLTKYTPFFPYYFPTTSNSLITKLSNSLTFLVPDDYNPDNENSNPVNISKNTGLFNYPLSPIEINDTLNTKRNILFFIVESWRSDMMNKETTPNIYNLAQKSCIFKNHYSGGNVTIPGLFSIMYGLHPSYMSYAQSNPAKYKTVLTKTLAEYGYDIKVYTSQNFDRFALKAMFFNGIKPENYNCIYKGKTEVIDSLLTEKLIEDLKKDKTGTPWFKFMFLSSSHYHYNYPPEHKIFTPVPKNSEGFLFNKDIDAQPYLNDYRNSLHYEDALFKKITDRLKQTEQFGNTIIFVLSDHGEEFNDNHKGYWGHGSNFTKYQISTPLIIHIPGQEEQVITSVRSSHIDIVPTVLKHFLKCKNPASDYSNGHSLFNLPDKRNLVITSYKDKCYLVDDNVYSTGITIKSYDVNDLNSPVDHYNYSGLNAIKQEELSFIKK